jgi:hypothetical protein
VVAGFLANFPGFVVGFIRIFLKKDLFKKVKTPIFAVLKNAFIAI